jgi:pimeloyl-ACP methyl ester carboxylesterase
MSAAADRQYSPPLELGVITRLEGAGEWRLSGHAFAPEGVRDGSPLLVAVHGISRDVREQLDAFAPLARACGLPLLAPSFDGFAYRDYQRLGRVGRGLRADLALEELIGRIPERLGFVPGPLRMFGYSGGGQFVHRFLMAHPERVEAAVVASPGWYTFPDPTLGFPYGLRVGPELPGVRMVPAAFLRVPILVLVGAGEVERDESLRRTPGVDRRQGENRVERATRWVEAMNEAARVAGIAERVRLERLPVHRHGFVRSLDAGLADRVKEFLGGETSDG